jgi:hypothetical protein
LKAKNKSSKMEGVCKFDLIAQNSWIDYRKVKVLFRILAAIRIPRIQFIYLLGLMQIIISYETRVFIQVVSSMGSNKQIESK